MAVVSDAHIVNPRPVCELIDRVGGKGTSKRIITIVDENMSSDGRDVFVLSSRHGRPLIKGSSLSALTAGLGWYFNHYLHGNVSWSSLSIDMGEMIFPIPRKEERHECSADYRYYLNYCTFSYSMAFWSEERWMQEVDWMALHGVNMPLMLVGTDVVWRNVCLELGYSEQEISKFIAGPGFQAWWMMGNLEGWGGPNPEWWYERQSKLCRAILGRMRELGMEPVLPGYGGMMPSNAQEKLSMSVKEQGFWCEGFRRPSFLIPTDEDFMRVSEIYYRHLDALMGKSTYYSMDPFHEGGSTRGVDVKSAYMYIYEQMKKTSPNAKWVIQSWQDNPRQEALEAVPKGDFIVLDLFSEAVPKWQNGYSGHDFVWCMLHNYGGRSGIHGRMQGTVDGYFAARDAFPETCRGIGATPEGIETNPILYELLFELPWLSQKPDIDEWIDKYVIARYGKASENMSHAWKLIASSALDCKTVQQGASESVMCARPSLHMNSVSSWSTCELYYDASKLREAALLMENAGTMFGGNGNYLHDLIDVQRQVMADSAYVLLKHISESYESKSSEEFKNGYESFLSLMLDADKLLSKRREFTFDTWASSARAVCDEVEGTTEADRDWMEWNARTLVSMWGPETAAESGGLRDYSNRMWAGMLKDYYYERWSRFFSALDSCDPNISSSEWYRSDSLWTAGKSRHRDSLTVMSYNLRFGELASMQEIGSYISEFKPDIVALQECDWATMREGVRHQHGVRFVNELACHTGMFGLYGKTINFSGGYYGIGLLSKYPIVRSERVMLPAKSGNEPRAMLVSEIELPSGTRIVFCCTHLDAFNAGLRRRQMEFINDYFKDKGPVIIAGDMNADPEEMSFMEETWMNVSYSVPTYPASDPSVKLDYIYVRPYTDFIPISSDAPQSDLSDHLPIVSKIVFFHD